MTTSSLKLFGTDGIRGKFGEYPLNTETIEKLSLAISVWLNQKINFGHQPVVLIGKDTRESGRAIENTIKNTLINKSIDVAILDVIPTPALSFMVKELKADLAIMISASHNSYEDNGIKIFKSNSEKLSDEEEAEIENLFLEVSKTPDLKTSGQECIIHFEEIYQDFILSTLPKDFSLKGLKIALDCANGATYKIAPKIFESLGCEVVSIGINPDGKNINHKVGSTSPESLQEIVLSQKCAMGIAFDGDGDRVLFVDENATLVDGDQLMAILSSSITLEDSDLKPKIVTTVMSNLGLEKYLEEKNFQLLRTKVGDRYVYQAMKENQSSLGGEQSGHIIMLNYSTTGDGILAALHILKEYIQTSNNKSFFQRFVPSPQVLKNIPLQDPSVIETIDFKNAVKTVEQSLSNNGRILIRKSGTEPLLRVMIESDDIVLLEKNLNHILSLVATK